MSTSTGFFTVTDLAWQLIATEDKVSIYAAKDDEALLFIGIAPPALSTTQHVPLKQGWNNLEGIDGNCYVRGSGRDAVQVRVIRG